MSGGMAFVLDEDGDFKIRLNPEMVALEPFDDPEDVQLVKSLIQEHYQTTGSETAEKILTDWDEMKKKFVKVMPMDYRRVLEEQKRSELTTSELPSEAIAEAPNG
jgi:glutamate synthase (ferredoxin)